MKISKFILILLLICLSIPIKAQYSGQVGDYITLPEPSLPGGYEIYAAEYYTTSNYLEVAKGTSRVKITAYFTGTETAQCDYYCVRQYIVSGRMYNDYKSGTAYYTITCTGDGLSGGDTSGGGNGGGTTIGSITLSANPSGGKINKGSAVTLTANYSSALIAYTLDGTNPHSSSTRQVVSSGSKVTINKSCTLKAFAQYVNTSKDYSWNYTVIETKVDPIKVDFDSYIRPFIMRVGDTFKFRYNSTYPDKVHPNNYNYPRAFWYTSDKKIAEISSDGIVTAKAPGSVKIEVLLETLIWAQKTIVVTEKDEYNIMSGDVDKISAGNPSLVLMKDGTLWGCGDNRHGQLGNNNKSKFNTTLIELMSGIKNMYSHYSNCFFIKPDNTLWGCGHNSEGELGIGNREEINMPVKILDNVNDVVSGDSHSLFLMEDGSVWGCGANYSGQLGIGVSKSITEPVKIMDNVIKIAAQDRYSLFLKNDGSLWGCGGNYYGQLADDEKDITEPAKIADDVASMSAGVYHILILKKDGTLWGRGRSSEYQLGTYGYTYKPISLRKITDNVVDMGAGMYNSILLKSDGTLMACGSNEYGECGDGTFDNIYKFKTIMNDVSQISVSLFYSLVLKKDGSLWAFGSNENGNLGEGTTINRSTPIKIIEYRGETNSINTINKDIKKKHFIYNLSGKRLNSKQKGINIIDGKKVLVK